MSVGALPLAVLLIAVAINSIYNVMYAYFIARSAAVSILAVNLTTLVGGAIMWLSIPARLGMMMGAAMVVGSAIIQVAVGTVLFHRLHRQEGI